MSITTTNDSIAANKYNRIIIQQKCHIQTDNCSICLDSLAMKQIVYLPCQHIFHNKCLHQAFEQQIYSCPLCRYDLVEALKKTQFKFPINYDDDNNIYDDEWNDLLFNIFDMDNISFRMPVLLLNNASSNQNLLLLFI